MALLETLSAVGSLGAGLGSLFGGSDASDDAKKARRAATAIAGQAFQGVPVFGPGGTSLTFGGTGAQTSPVRGGGIDDQRFPPPGEPFGFDPETGTHYDAKGNALPGGLRQIPGGRGAKVTDLGAINIGAGDQQLTRDLLTSLSQGLFGGVGGGTSAVQDQAFANLLASTGGFGQEAGTLDALLGATGGAFGGAAQGLQQAQANPFLQGLQNQLFGDAGGLFAEAALGGEAQRAQTLDLLRQQAQPFEERAFSNLQDNLFSTGRLGTTGGGLQTEAFARGLGQADLQRQLAAGQEGRAAQAAALSTGLGLAGQGTGLRTLQDTLLNQAQNRFTSLAGLSSQLSNQRTGVNQAQFGQNLQVLQNALLPQLQAQQLGQGNLQQIIGSLGAIQGIDQNALAQAQLGLQAAGQQANARLGAATTFAGTPIPQSNTPTMLAQLSQALAPQGGAINTLAGALGGLFNRGGGGIGPTSNTLGTGQDFFNPILVPPTT